MDREEIDRLAEEMMEQRVDLITSLYIPQRAALQAAFRFGRAYGLCEAAMIMEKHNGPKPPMESDPVPAPPWDMCGSRREVD